MKSRRWIPALGAFFVLVALAVSACGSAVPSNSVATVAGNPISTKAFNHWLYVDAKGQQAAQGGVGQPVIAPNDPPSFTKCIAQARASSPQLKKVPAKTLRADCKQLFTSLSSSTLNFLITGYWFQALAHRQGINVTAAQVQKALDKAKSAKFKTNAQYEAYLKQTGQTNADEEYQFRVKTVFQRLLAKQSTTVTSADISAYYNSHKSQFGTPQRRNMRIVLAKSSAQAAAAKKALQHGQSWSTVAKRYSTDPTTKNKGGQLTGVTAGTQDAALSKAAFAAPANKLQGPVKGQFGYYVLEVTKIIPATTRSLAQSTALIKRTLTIQKQRAAQTAITNAAKKEFGSKTVCRSAYSMALCKGYTAPKTTSTPSTAPPSTPPATSSSSSAGPSTTSTTSSK